MTRSHLLMFGAFVLASLATATTLADDDRVILLIDQTLYSQVETNLLRYETEVEGRFPVSLELHVGTFAGQTAEQVRAYIQGIYDAPGGLDGVILCGQLPYALWRQDPAFGTNTGIMAFFYEDLDGSFTDTDSDGYYDYHDWGTLDGPEVWSCWMRPPVMDQAGYLNALLDEAHDYYVGNYVTSKQGYVACHGDYDGNFWDGTIPSMPALVGMYGLENVGTDGEGSDPVYGSELLAQLLSTDYEIVHFWSHAYAGGEAWDSGWIYSSSMMSAPAGKGPLIAHIYGCHSGDFVYYEGASAGNTNIAVSYAFGPGAGQASSGTSWSYGTEGMNLITEKMAAGWYLGRAWKYLLDTKETSVAIHQRYADRDVHKELSGNNLFGNPFLYANWTGTPYDDPYPPELVGAGAAGSPNLVTVDFSEPLDPATAQNPANYTIDNGVGVTGAVLEADEATVTLTTTVLSEGVTYTLMVSNVMDQADPPNTILPGSSTTFHYTTWDRVTQDLVVLYDFEEGAGTTVHDISGTGTPLNLVVDDETKVTWTTHGVRIDTNARLASASVASELAVACMNSHEVTIEAWIIPTTAVQGGPACIVTLSPHANSRDFTLGHGLEDGTAADAYNVRLRTTTTNDNGIPGLTTANGSVLEGLQHVVYTRDAEGAAVIYIDGVPVGTGTIDGNFTTWSTSYRLVLGNEYNLTKPWYGEYRAAAVYCRALEATEVQRNYAAGPDANPGGFELGDLNCDGAADVFDIDAFVLALTDAGAYVVAYPECDRDLADCNEDGAVDVFDIDAFVALLTNG
ncbi:MAG: Ig-like domain-containing protein [Phycisphaerae bacterium]|nr:Ig-like domain-containing protein [Phycisphaerae bacterium]